MKKTGVWLLALLLAAGQLQAQVTLTQGWKFHTGDQQQWARPDFNDKDWKPIEAGAPWENQGYKDYNGYGWYRLHVTIPSSLKDRSYLKGDLKISLGKIDDGDQVYLNGKLIGQNAGRGGTIEDGPYNALRVYQVKLNDPAIHWDGENVIAVRVYDHGGGGGMYEGPYSLDVTDVTDYVEIDFQSSGFQFPKAGHLKKEIILQSTSAQFDFNGKLTVKITDPANGRVISEQSTPAHFSNARPYHFVYTASLPKSKSYRAQYDFHESRSGKDVTAHEGIPYILTPKPGPAPRINGARVTGVRPGHPFLFRVPVTGDRPMHFTAKNLPGGLQIDPSTGIISGTTDSAGIYEVQLTASNKRGMANRRLKIVVGSQIALTPAMGWNSWNCWGLSVSDAKVRASTDAMIKKGLVNHGWNYINIDDGWQAESRAADGEIRANGKFPDMKDLADYVHGLGLKIGIYSSPGPRTCGGFLGSYRHVSQDAQTYAKWGIDYLKYDWCSYGGIAPKDPDLEELQRPYRRMRSALDSIPRDIYYSLCQYGMGDVWKWGGAVGGNSWRTTGDIRDTWSSMSGIGFSQDKASPYAKPGNWNDPDMLVVGKVGWGPSLHDTRLSPDEQYTHISLWCLLSAPLLIGCDMSQLDDFTLNLLTNDEVLAVDQDPLGNGAVKVKEDGDIQVWAKELEDGSKAVGIFNLGEKTADATLSLADLKLSGRQEVRDLWRQKNLGRFTGSYKAENIPSHGVLLVKISAAR